MINSIAFDIDEILLDSERIYYNRLISFLDSINETYDEEILKEIIGLDFENRIKIVEKSLNKNINKEDFIKGYKSFFENETINYSEILFEDTSYIIKDLHKKGNKLSVLSRLPLEKIEKILDETDLSKYFLVKISLEKNPLDYLEILKNKTKSSYDEILIISNDKNIIKKAKEKKVLVLSRDDERFSSDKVSDYIEKDIRNVKIILENLNKLKIEDNLELRLMKYGSKDYIKSLYLRNNQLRKSLGLNIFNENLKDERNDILIGLFKGEEIIGNCTIKYINKDIAQICNVAVDKEYENNKLGKKIMLFAENIIKESGRSKIFLNARITAIKFYENIGYKPVTEVYKKQYPDTDVYLEHIDMEKII